MITENRGLGTLFIKRLLNGLRVLFLLGCMSSVFYLIFIVVGVITDTPPLAPAYPVVMSLSEEGTFLANSSSNTESTVFTILPGTVRVSTRAASSSFIIMHTALVFLLTIAILYTLHLTIRILEDIADNKFFVTQNAVRLRWIAILGIAISTGIRCSALISSHYISDKLEYPGLEFTNFSIFSLIDITPILFSLLLLVIAEAFRVGIQLQKETELTI